MAQALIRRIKDETLEAFRVAAREKGRSLEAELREVIEMNRPPAKKDSAALLELSKRLRANTPPSAAQVDSTEYLRWARDTDAGRYLGGARDDAGR